MDAIGLRRTRLWSPIRVQLRLALAIAWLTSSALAVPVSEIATETATETTNVEPSPSDVRKPEPPAPPEKSALESAPPANVPTATDLRIAADRFDEGRSSFRVGAFAEAAEHFEAADARAPSVSALGLAMRSRAEAGHFAKASTLAELVLVRHPEQTELVEQANGFIAAHRSEFGRLDIECATRCELIVDKKLVHGQALSLWHVHVEGGPHDVVANLADGSVVAAKVTVLNGESASVHLEPPPKPVAAPPVVLPNPAPPAEVVLTERVRLAPLYFWIGVGATTVLTGATVWSGIDTLYNPGQDAVRDACAGLDTNCPLYQEGQRKELRTNILLGSTLVVGLATATTGLFLTDFSRPKAEPKRGAPHFSIRPMVGLSPSAPGSKVGLVGAEGRF